MSISIVGIDYSTTSPCMCFSVGQEYDFYYLTNRKKLIGSFDTDQIFYLRSRGLNEQQAKSFLIKSFYKDLLDFINHKNFLIEIEKITNNWLHNNIGA